MRRLTAALDQMLSVLESAFVVPLIRFHGLRLKPRIDGSPECAAVGLNRHTVFSQTS
jgi:hypothetical protein